MNDNPVALVTGAARGIGASIAVELASNGFDVAVFDVIDSAETVSEIEKRGRKGLALTGDVTKADDRAAALDAIKAEFGRLDCLVNNAGVAPKVRADILEATEESYDRVMGINLKGPYFLTQAVANWMIEQHEKAPDVWRCIVNTSSMSAYTASTARGEYCLSKAGVSMAR
jgi:NAD(P)-dependent dehydrogenase (short-subunit alcohol dehydrogenase family)